MYTWIPLESDPKVFNEWANKAGLVPSSAQYHDLYGLDPELLSMVPRAVKAVVLVFPYGEALARRNAEDERIAKEGGPKVDGSVFWVKQTIQGACGTMALIHGMANSDVSLTPESPLRNFINECRDKSPLERAKLLETTPSLKDIHASVVGKGQSAIPSAEIDVDQAFTCFVVVPCSTGPRVVELDGTRAGPVDRGACTDLLEDVARIVREEFINKSASVKFNLMYLGQAM